MPALPPRRPDPPPLELHDRHVVLLGSAVWLAALVGLAVARLLGAGVHGWWLGMCAYGVGLGLFGLRYVARRDRARRSPRRT